MGQDRQMALLKPEIEKLYQLAGANKYQLNILWAVGEGDEDIIPIIEDEDDDAEGFIFPGELYDLKRIQNELNILTKTISTIKKFHLKDNLPLPFISPCNLVCLNLSDFVVIISFIF